MGTGKGPTRDRETGRYAHEWGFIGFNEQQSYQIDRCEDCGKVRVGGHARIFKSVEDAAAHGITGFLEGYGPEPAPRAQPERTPDLGTQPCSNCGYSVALHGTPGRPLCADCAAAANNALDSNAPESDLSPTPHTEASTKGAATMAITDRNLEPGTKLVAKYKGTTYHAEVVKVDQDGNEATRYRMTLNGAAKDYKTPSAAGSAIFGIDAAGKPRTCNGWGFWSIDAGEAPQETTAKPKGRTRRSKKDEATTEAPTDPHAGLPIIQRIEGDYECGECCDFTASDREGVAQHIRETHPSYAPELERIDATEPEAAVA